MRSRIPFPIGLVIGGLLSGCGPQEPPPALPPPPSERGGFGDPSTSSGRTPSIVLVLPAMSTLESILLLDAATKEAGVQKFLLEARRPRPGDPLQAQATLIREAARDGASAIIVLVNNDTSLAEAIDAVQGDGTPVVVVGDALECKTSPHRVDTGDYFKAANELVKIAVDEAKQGGLDVAQPPMLLIRELAPDSHAEERIAALEKALAEARYEPIRVKYADNEADAANALEEALKEHPKTTLVFADTDQSMMGVTGVLDQHGRQLTPGDPAPFVFAGFLSDPLQVNAMKMSGSMAGFIDWNVPGIARVAVRDALKLSKGEKLPELSEVSTPVIRPKHASPRPRETRAAGRIDG